MSPTPEFLADRFGLSPSDSQTAAGIAAGKVAKAVARERGISVHTVATHLERIFMKTGTNTQLAFAVAAWRAWSASTLTRLTP